MVPRPRNALFGKIQPVKVLACQPPKSKGGTGWQIDAEFPRQLMDVQIETGLFWTISKVFESEACKIPAWALLWNTEIPAISPHCLILLWFWRPEMCWKRPEFGKASPFEWEDVQREAAGGWVLERPSQLAGWLPLNCGSQRRKSILRITWWFQTIRFFFWYLCSTFSDGFGFSFPLWGHEPFW